MGDNKDENVRSDRSKAREILNRRVAEKLAADFLAINEDFEKKLTQLPDEPQSRDQKFGALVTEMHRARYDAVDDAMNDLVAFDLYPERDADILSGAENPPEPVDEVSKRISEIKKDRNQEIISFIRNSRNRIDKTYTQLNGIIVDAQIRIERVPEQLMKEAEPEAPQPPQLMKEAGPEAPQPPQFREDEEEEAVLPLFIAKTPLPPEDAPVEQQKPPVPPEPEDDFFLLGRPSLKKEDLLSMEDRMKLGMDEIEDEIPFPTPKPIYDEFSIFNPENDLRRLRAKELLDRAVAGKLVSDFLAIRADFEEKLDQLPDEPEARDRGLDELFRKMSEARSEAVNDAMNELVAFDVDENKISEILAVDQLPEQQPSDPLAEQLSGIEAERNEAIISFIRNSENRRNRSYEALDSIIIDSIRSAELAEKQYKDQLEAKEAEKRAAERVKKAEEERLAEEARKAEQERLAEEARKAEEERLAEEVRKAAQANVPDDNLKPQIKDALNAVRDKITLLTAPDTYGQMPKLTADDIAELKTDFLGLIDMASEYISRLPEHPRVDQQLFGADCDNIRKSALQDFIGLENARPGQTLSRALMAAGTRVVDVSGKELQKVGAVLSSRNPLKISGEDGMPVKGFFTRRRTLDVQHEVDVMFRSLKKQFPHLEAKAAQLQNIMMDEHKLFAAKTKERNELINSVKNAKDKHTLDVFANHIQESLTLQATYQAMNLDDSKSPVDTRNVAMSRVADLLGCGHLLARSVPMKLVDNNREIEGTFMYNVPGSDIDHPKEGDPILNIKDGCFDHSPVLCDLSDINIVDIICMNVDRHPGNFIYQVDNSNPDEPKIVGITGIDNDMSFGCTLIDNGLMRNTNTSGLEGITNISASMAERVRALDPEMLRMALDGTGLEKRNVDMAVLRLNLLKQRLNDERNPITVIPDDKFKDYTLKELTPPDQLSNAFSNASLAVGRLRNNILDQLKPAEADQEEEALDLTSVFDRNSLAQDIGPIRYFANGLTLATKKVYGGSRKYDIVMEKTAELQTLLSKFSDPEAIAVEKDAEAVLNAYQDIKDACNAYLDRKRADGHINDGENTKPGKRIKAVKDLLTFCKNRYNVLNSALHPEGKIDEIAREMAAGLQESFRSLTPAELGQYIKSLNETANMDTTDSRTLSKVGAQLSAASTFAIKNKLSPQMLGLTAQDYKDAAQNIEKGRKANITLRQENEEKLTRAGKMERDNNKPAIMKL